MKSRRPSLLGGLALAIAAGLAAAPAPAVAGQSAPASREFIAPKKEQRTKRKKVVAKKDDPKDGPPPKRWPGRWGRKARRRIAKYVGSTRSQKWQMDKQGNAIDGRGDYRSAKRLLRARFCARAALAGYPVTSGRRWVRLRRFLRWQAKGLGEATR